MRKDCTCPLCVRGQDHKLLKLLMELTDKMSSKEAGNRDIEP